jgi:hypothetical protein
MGGTENLDFFDSPTFCEFYVLMVVFENGEEMVKKW